MLALAWSDDGSYIINKINTNEKRRRSAWTRVSMLALVCVCVYVCM
jgi:hypothetical protein